jgi:dihydrofolate synthase/folylpolyglutamate synthase
MEVEMLKAAATELGLQGKAYTSVRRALSAAKKSAAAEDLILVCGSIFVVAEVL